MAALGMPGDDKDEGVCTFDTVALLVHNPTQPLVAVASNQRRRKRGTAAENSPESYYKTVLSLDPSDADMMCNYAELLARLGPSRCSEAEEHMLRALALRPQSSSIHNRYGLFLERDRGDIKEAESMYTKAIGLEPGDAAPALRNLAALALTHHSDMPRKFMLGFLFVFGSCGAPCGICQCRCFGLWRDWVWLCVELWSSVAT